MYRIVQISKKSAIIEHAKAKMHKKDCEFEDIQETQKLGDKYKKKMTSTPNTPTGESLRNLGKISEYRKEGLEKLSHVSLLWEDVNIIILYMK